MAKRNWPDHVAVGRVISVDRGKGSESMQIVDVKCGPMMASVDFGAKDHVLHGTLKLCLKPVEGGAEFWTPPTDGEALVKWCEQQASTPEGETR